MKKKVETKSCKRCQRILPCSAFEIVKRGRSDGKQKYGFSAWCNECKKDYELFKTCNICKEKLPKTEDYFNIRREKNTNKSGPERYISLRTNCRNCTNKKTAKIKREKYWKDPEKGREISRQKYWKDHERSRNNTKRWVDNNRDKLIEKDRRRVAELEDSWLASMIGIPVKECPKSLLETKRSLIKLKRILGLTSSTIKERNINNKYKKQWKQKEI